MAQRSALGLRRGATLLYDYDPRWPIAYQEELAALRSVLPESDAGVEHIGSTAVPGLVAKPILDIAIGCSDESKVEEIHGHLESLGYVFHRDQGEGGGLVYIKGPEACRTHYIHLVGRDSAQWRNYIRFREALREDDDLRGAYGGLKQELARRFPDDRVSYLEGKGDFVEGVLSSDSDYAMGRKQT